MLGRHQEHTMKFNCLPMVAAWACVAVLVPATAQTAAPRPLPGASASDPAKAGPRALTPAEKRDSATPADESRPEGPVVPQISIPLGKPTAEPLKPTLRAARPAPTASSGGVNDAVARCEAQADAATRARCRDRLAHQGSSR
jgi:hypothetical protein